MTDKSIDAFEILMKYRGTLSEDFDYKAELETARTEKYDNIKGVIVPDEITNCDTLEAFAEVDEMKKNGTGVSRNAGYSINK